MNTDGLLAGGFVALALLFKAPGGVGIALRHIGRFRPLIGIPRIGHIERTAMAIRAGQLRVRAGAVGPATVNRLRDEPLR